VARRFLNSETHHCNSYKISFISSITTHLALQLEVEVLIAVLLTSFVPTSYLHIRTSIMKRSTVRRGLFLFLAVIALTFIWPDDRRGGIDFESADDHDTFYDNYLQYASSMDTPLTPPEGFARWIKYATKNNCSLNLEDYKQVRNINADLPRLATMDQLGKDT
jgi:hypothetical protein